jgi:hypothetical protein
VSVAEHRRGDSQRHTVNEVGRCNRRERRFRQRDQEREGVRKLARLEAQTASLRRADKQCNCSHHRLRCMEGTGSERGRSRSRTTRTDDRSDSRHRDGRTGYEHKLRGRGGRGSGTAREEKKAREENGRNDSYRGQRKQKVQDSSSGGRRSYSEGNTAIAERLHHMPGKGPPRLLTA